MLYPSAFGALNIMRSRTNLFFVTIIIVLFAQPAVSKLYKWVDDEGKTHYTDKLPPEHAEKSHSEINERGIEVNKVDRAKSADELAQEKELERLRKEQEKLIEQQKAEDRVLLKTFRSEDDIIMAMDGKLTAIDVMIGIIRSNIRQSKSQLEEMQNRAAIQERMGKKPSHKLLQDIASTRQQLKNSYATIIKREKDKERIKKKGNQDLERFRELKKLQASRAPEIERKARTSQLDYVIACTESKACDAYWEKAKEYALKHTTTKAELISESVILTATPKADDGISITLSRISKEDEPGEHIFFDLQCKPSKKGKKFCEEESVKKIKNGFKLFVLGGAADAESKQ
jgi:hypothetical protein